MEAKNIREAILAAEDLHPIKVEIAEWGVKGQLRPLDGESRYRISQLAATVDHKKENSCIAEAYICESLCDESGNRVFSLDDRKVLATKDPAVIERLYNQVLEISGITQEDEDAAEKK